MWKWLRKRLTATAPMLDRSQGRDLPSFKPNGARLLSTLEDIETMLIQESAIIYITVEWSGQERQSRLVFEKFIRQIEQQYPEFRVTLWVLSEYSEGVAQCFDILKLPTTVATGYGAVIWLDRGQVLGLVPYAAEAGVQGLVNRTMEFQGRAESGARLDRPSE